MVCKTDKVHSIEICNFNTTKQWGLCKCCALNSNLWSNIQQILSTYHYLQIWAMENQIVNHPSHSALQFGQKHRHHYSSVMGHLHLPAIKQILCVNHFTNYTDQHIIQHYFAFYDISNCSYETTHQTFIHTRW